MAWSRVKNILIAMLIAANAFLLVIYGITTWRENQYQDQVKADLQAVAASLNITISEELVQPEVQTLLPLQVYADDAQDQLIAVQLLGECEPFSTEDGAVAFETTQGKLLLASEGELDLTLYGKTAKTEHKARAQVKKILKTLGQNARDLVVLPATEDARFRIKADLFASGMPVFNASLIFEFKTESLHVTGKRLLHHPQQVSGTTIQELPGLLLRLFGYWQEQQQGAKTITGIDLGYLTKNRTGKRMTVLPVWRVSENNAVWYISAVDGSVISAE